MVWAIEFGRGAKALAQFFGARWSREQALEQGLQIKSGTTNDDGQAPVSGNLGDGSTGQLGIIAGGEWLGRIGNVEQVMRNAGALVR